MKNKLFKLKYYKFYDTIEYWYFNLNKNNEIFKYKSYHNSIVKYRSINNNHFGIRLENFKYYEKFNN